MKALRIKLTQNKANYGREETVTKKMTYPLPPFSTVIGAIHKACNFKEYHPMDISIQGNFSSMSNQVYTAHTYLDTLSDDRGMLVKLKNSSMHTSAEFNRVAETTKSTGNSFEKEVNLKIYNKILLEQYKYCRVNKRILSNEKKNDKALASYTRQLKDLKEEQKVIKKANKDNKDINKSEERLLELKNLIADLTKQKNLLEDDYKNKIAELDAELDKFANLVTSIMYYEVLHEVELVIHILTDDETTNIIQENIYNLTSIGRSEDFVDITECERVDIFDNCNIEDLKEYNSDFDSEDFEVYSKLYSYVSSKVFKEKHIVIKANNGRGIIGTKYFLNKDYTIENNKRVFNKYSVIYSKNISIDDGTLLGKETNIYLDKDKYIINFI